MARETVAVRRVLVTLVGAPLAALILAAPAAAADRDSAVGIGITIGALDSGRNADSIEFEGYTLFGKIGLDPHWGVLLSYRDMSDEDFLLFFQDGEYTQVSAQGSYLWRPRKRLRPFVKFGLTRLDYEGDFGSVPNRSDDGIGYTFGWGLEIGGGFVAFLLDWDYARVDLFGDSTDVVNISFGAVLKL